MVLEGLLILHHFQRDKSYVWGTRKECGSSETSTANWKWNCDLTLCPALLRILGIRIESDMVRFQEMLPVHTTRPEASAEGCLPSHALRHWLFVEYSKALLLKIQTSNIGVLWELLEMRTHKFCTPELGIEMCVLAKAPGGTLKFKKNCLKAMVPKSGCASKPPGEISKV